MSTTSPIFGFILATTSDTVNVVTQIAGNFSSLDSIIGVAHTGTGQLKSNLAINTPTLQSPVISGTMTGGTIVSTVGKFNTVTATAGSVVVDSLGVGTYSYPTTIGSSGQLLTVSAGNAVWVDNVPNTGASLSLDNLDTVAINTSLNNFTAGAVVVNSIKATAGTLSGLTSVVSTTGTFSGLNIVGTLNADAINVTGGVVKVASFSIGTYSYANTVGSAGQVLTVVTGNAVFASNVMTRSPVVFEWHGGDRIATATIGNGMAFWNVDTCPSLADIGTKQGSALWCMRNTSGGAYVATTASPSIRTVFYKHSHMNTLQFNFLGVVNGPGASTATGTVLVAIGTASGVGTLVKSGGSEATTGTAFSLAIDVSTLPNTTSYPLLICLGVANSSAGLGGYFAINDMIGYVIS